MISSIVYKIYHQYFKDCIIPIPHWYRSFLSKLIQSRSLLSLLFYTNIFHTHATSTIHKYNIQFLHKHTFLIDQLANIVAWYECKSQYSKLWWNYHGNPLWIVFTSNSILFPNWIRKNNLRKVPQKMACI